MSTTLSLFKAYTRVTWPRVGCTVYVN